MRVEQAKEKHQQYDAWLNELVALILILRLIDGNESISFDIPSLGWPK